MSYFPVSRCLEDSLRYESYKDRNYLLEKENERLTSKIQTDLRNHWVRDSIVVPCQLKKNYESLLSKSFCPKTSWQKPFGSSYFGRSRVNEIV